MVVKEAHEGRRGHLEEVVGIGRPDGRPHGQHEVLDELLGVGAAAQVVAQGGLLVRSAQQGASGGVEARHVAQHAVEGGSQQIAGLGEEPAQSHAAPFETAALAVQSEAHVRGLGCDSQLAQQTREVRVGGVVVDDEAGVDRIVPPRHRHVDGVGVAPDAVLRLEELDPVARMQEVGGHQAGDAAADDRDPHAASPRGAMRTWVTHHS